MINSAGKPKFFMIPLSPNDPFIPSPSKQSGLNPQTCTHRTFLLLLALGWLSLPPTQHHLRTCLSIPTLSPPNTTEAPIGSLILLQLIKVRQRRMQLQKTEVIGKQLHNIQIPKL